MDETARKKKRQGKEEKRQGKEEKSRFLPILCVEFKQPQFNHMLDLYGAG